MSLQLVALRGQSIDLIHGLLLTSHLHLRGLCNCLHCAQCRSLIGENSSKTPSQLVRRLMVSTTSAKLGRSTSVEVVKQPWIAVTGHRADFLFAKSVNRCKGLRAFGALIQRSGKEEKLP